MKCGPETPDFEQDLVRGHSMATVSAPHALTEGFARVFLPNGEGAGSRSLANAAVTGETEASPCAPLMLKQGVIPCE